MRFSNFWGPMVRYLGQRDTFRCGPIAIANALKWSGKGFSGKYCMWYFEEISGCSLEEGTNHSGITRGLKMAGRGHFRASKSIHVTASSITEHVREKEGAVILCFLSKTKKENIIGGHICLIIGVSKSGKTFYAVNYYTGIRAFLPVRKTTLERSLKRERWLGQKYPSAWYLKRLS